MPVSNISVVGVRFSTSGAGRWIGQRSSTSMSPAWSMGSPSRLKMRPSVTSPTGTVIGPPVSTTSIPRARPSVESMATARTRSSPRCCCTSQTMTSSSAPALTPSCSISLLASGRAMVIALLISGSSSGNTASITTPVISSMRPTFLPSLWRSSFFSSVAAIGFSLAQRLGAGDDFHDLLGDLGLAGPVHLQGEVFDELPRVLRGVAHSGHARAVLGRGGLQQGAVDRDLHVVRDEPLEDLLGVGLVLDERAVPRALRVVAVLVLVLLEDRGLLQRQQRLAAHVLRERGDVAVVEDLHAVDLAVDVGGDQVLGDLARVGVLRAVGEADVGARGVALAEAQRRDAAPPGGVPLQRAPLVLVLGGGAQARADDLRVERAGQAAVAGDEQQPHGVDALVLLEDREVRDVLGRLGRLAGHAADRARVGPQRGDALLGPAQARRRDHLHGAGDLLDVLDRGDPVLDVTLGGHRYAFAVSCSRVSSSSESPLEPSTPTPTSLLPSPSPPPSDLRSLARSEPPSSEGWPSSSRS